MSNTDGPEPPDGDDLRPDPLGEAVAAFLSDLLDNTVVALHTGAAEATGVGAIRLPSEPVLGADGLRRQFSLRSLVESPVGPDSASAFPQELADLPAASLRALERMARASVAADQIQPSLARALHEVVVVEVLADRLLGRLAPGTDTAALVALVAETLEYIIELAATRLEGNSVTHGVALCTDLRGWEPRQPHVGYPGRLPSRKRTPLLFDGTESALAVAPGGAVLGEVSRSSLPRIDDGRSIETFDASLGVSGALTAAASAAFRGVGVYLRADRSIWVFDDGQPLFIRRTNRWKSIAMRSFADWLARLGHTSPANAQVLAQAVLRASIQGTGAIFAIASDRSELEDLLARKDLVSTNRAAGSSSTVDDDLHTLLDGSDLSSPAGLARLARLDGATVISRDGALLAYGAIVRSADSRGEGARTAAARSLSLRAHLAVSVSQDGPVTVFHHGEVVLELL